jgi:hypothetical protein
MTLHSLAATMRIGLNKEVDSSKREDRKIRRIETRSAIVNILYNLIKFVIAATMRIGFT